MQRDGRYYRVEYEGKMWLVRANGAQHAGRVVADKLFKSGLASKDDIVTMVRAGHEIMEPDNRPDQIDIEDKP